MNPAIHHANIRIEATPASRRLDDGDPQPGYEGMILRSADFPDGHFLGWTPGQAPAVFSDLTWPLESSSDFVVQLHLRPTGEVEAIDIRAGGAAHVVDDSFVLPVDLHVHSVLAHAHYRVPFWLPEGTTIRLTYAFDNSSDNPRNRTQLDALGIGYAAAGRFADAIGAADAALALPALSPEFAADVRTRLAPYHSGRAFTLPR